MDEDKVEKVAGEGATSPEDGVGGPGAVPESEAAVAEEGAGGGAEAPAAPAAEGGEAAAETVAVAQSGGEAGGGAEGAGGGEGEGEGTGPCGRLLRIEASVERVTEEIESSYEELRRTVFVKGFRPGHVPRHVLVRRFGEDVLEGVKQALMDEGYEVALEEHGLRPALAPDAEPDAVTVEPGKALAFEVRVEVVPEFTLDNYEGMVVERPGVAVGEADVDRAVESVRMRQGTFEAVADAVIEETDVPVCHVVVLVDGEEAWRRDELGAHIGDETVGGIPVPGLREAFVGAKAGESRTLRVTLPEEFPEEELKGKEVDLEVTVDEVRRFTAPEATDAWAEGLDFEGLEDLREELADQLRQRRERDADEGVQERIDDQLLELTSFEVPGGLVARLVEGAKERQRLALLYRGVGEEEIEKILSEQEQRTREGSIRQCRLHFIYLQLAEQEKLFVTEEDVEQRVQAIALNYGRRPDEVRAELEERGQLSPLRQQMREEKVRDFLVQHAEIQEAEAPEPAAAAGEGAGDAPPEETAGDGPPAEGAGDAAEPSADEETPPSDEPEAPSP